MGTSRSFAQLARKLDGPVRRQVVAEVARVAAKAAGAILRVIVPVTPVDTGRARSNYIITFGPLVEKEPDLVGPFDPSGLNAVARGLDALRGYRLEAGTINVANFVPYIELLAGGFSSQAAPGFMIESGLTAGSATVRAERIRIRI